MQARWKRTTADTLSSGGLWRADGWEPENCRLEESALGFLWIGSSSGMKEVGRTLHFESKSLDSLRLCGRIANVSLYTGLQLFVGLPPGRLSYLQHRLLLSSATTATRSQLRSH